MLWKIDFFVEGKDLEKCLAAAAGFALNMQPPRPVENAGIQLANGKKSIVAIGNGREPHWRKLANYMNTKLRPGEKIIWRQMRDMLIEINLPPAGAGSVITELKKEKIIIPAGKNHPRGTYFFKSVNGD